MTFLGDVDWVIQGNPDPEKVQQIVDVAGIRYGFEAGRLVEHISLESSGFRLKKPTRVTVKFCFFLGKPVGEIGVWKKEQE